MEELEREICMETENLIINDVNPHKNSIHHDGNAFTPRFIRIVSAIFVLLFTLYSCGCNNQLSESKSQGQSSTPAEINWKIGVMSDVGAIPFLVAREKGFYEKNGIKIDIQIFKSAIDRDTALQTGNLDGAMADMLTVLFFNEAGFDTVMAFGTDNDYQMVTSPGLDLENFLKLPKIDVGISSNTVIEFATQKIAEYKGFENRLATAAIPQMPVRLEMLKAKKLNAATLPQPLSTAAVLDGGIVIGSTAQYKLFPGIFIMTRKTANEKSDAVRALRRAYDESVEYLNQNPTGDYINLISEELSFPSALKGKHELPVFKKAVSADLRTFEEVSSWMKQKGLIQKSFTYDALTIPLQ
jgi:NitT/TauT family transport system substrate-binding protein